MPNSFHIHLVSDATGHTLESLIQAALVQFEGLKTVKHYWPMIRTPKQMERILEDIKENPGFVIHTLVDEDIQKVLDKGLRDMKLPSISVLDPLIVALGDHFGHVPKRLPGRQYIMDADYFARIDALDFTMAHDDGQLPENISEADIILVGVSRSSKTPTSIYLANRGYKTANVPFVIGCPLALDNFSTDGAFVVGLTVSPDRLEHIRSNRLKVMNVEDDTHYVDPEHIREEVQECRRYCARNGWPVIDVTRRSVEEVAAAIINLYQEHRDKLGYEGAKNEESL